MSLTKGCEWLGHCVGSICGDENDCDGVHFCINGVCGGEKCSWEGHCAGSICSGKDDCSDDLTCNDQVCSYPVKKEDLSTTTHSSSSPTSSPTSGPNRPTATDEPNSSGLSVGARAGIGVGVSVALLLVGLSIWLWLFVRRRRKVAPAQEEKDPEPEFPGDDKATFIRVLNPGRSTEIDSTPASPAEIDSKPNTKWKMMAAELNANPLADYCEIDSNPPRVWTPSNAPQPEGPNPPPTSHHMQSFTSGAGHHSPMRPWESGDVVSPVGVVTGAHQGGAVELDAGDDGRAAHVWRPS